MIALATSLGVPTHTQWMQRSKGGQRRVDFFPWYKP